MAIAHTLTNISSSINRRIRPKDNLPPPPPPTKEELEEEERELAQWGQMEVEEDGASWGWGSVCVAVPASQPVVVRCPLDEPDDEPILADPPLVGPFPKLFARLD